ncbi:MAG: DUF3810 domain-containing protein [Lachnospiraceae bacterium]|nr:DUF3810 domain-containing protein [Lachnospiraceae bacterium]
MLQKAKNKKLKKAIWVYIIIAILTLLLNVIAWNSTKFSDAYIKYIFPVWVNTYGRLTGIFPFSVGEILLVLGVCSIVTFLILFISILFLAIGGFLRKEKYPESKTKSSFWRFSKGYFCWFAWVVLIVCVIMTLNCSILYHASTFAEHYYGEEEGNYTFEDLVKVRNLVVEKCNALSQEMERDAEGNILYTGDMKETAIRTMQKLGQTYDQLDGYYPRPKPLAASDFFSQQYICGYYFPFSMEANYNDVMYIMNKPASMCHELAHLRGYILEDEANFISYLACIQSEDKVFEYSGYLSVLNYLDNDFYDAIGQNWEEYIAQPRILPQVHEDNIFLKQEDWDRVNEEALIDTETVDAVSDSFTDTTLKINGVEDGIISYNRVVELLLWYYDNQEKMVQE